VARRGVLSRPAPQADSRWWWIWERFTSTHAAVYRLSRGRIGGSMNDGAPIALIESVGRKSGKRRIHPLICEREGDSFVIVASKGGIDRHPAWYLNLKANPETTVNWRGENHRVRAREAEGAERDRLWDKMVETYRPYQSYQRRTDRRIPIVVLEPVAE
jgi:deazaflavin-dependent oxidoreductase (nitroreductase family)